MKAKLTKSFVERVPVGNQDKTIWDTDVRGFGLKVTPKGHRSYFVKYRVGGGAQGRQRKPSLGAHGILTCEQARQMARKWLAEARDGSDPLETRQMLSKAETVTDLIAHESKSLYSVAFVRLALMTGARKNELLTLRWSDVDLKQGRLHLPDSKTGKRAIVLSEPAKELLAILPRIKSNPHVLVGVDDVWLNAL